MGAKRQIPSLTIEELLRVQKAIERELSRRTCGAYGCGHSYLDHLAPGRSCMGDYEDTGMFCACEKYLELGGDG